MTIDRKLRRRGSRAALAASALTALMLPLAACSGGSASGGASAGASAASDPKAPITIWIDETRRPAVEAYLAANPDKKALITIDATSAGTALQKIALDNKAGSGWPDLVFLGNPADISALAAKPLSFSEPLNDLVPQATRDQFAKGTLENCTYNGKVFCLQNDVAQSVLWVNSKLMTKFGYTVPKTWDEYAALGAKVAKEHPGYLIGDIDTRTGSSVYLASSGCPTREVKSPTEVRINLTDPTCTRVAQLLQPLIANKSVSTVSEWDKGFVSTFGAADKILLFPHASWFGEYGFKGTYKTPNGEITAAPMPTWAGESEPWAGAEGGGLWTVSTHSKNKALAADLATFLSTNVDVLKAAATYPAYGPAAEAWIQARSTDAFYASDPTPAMKTEAGLIRSNFNFIRYESQFGDAWETTVVKAAAAGGDIAGALATWGTQITQAATDTGYTVSK